MSTSVTGVKGASRAGRLDDISCDSNLPVLTRNGLELYIKQEVDVTSYTHFDGGLENHCRDRIDAADGKV